MQYSVGPGTLAEIVELTIAAEDTNNTCLVELEVATASIGMDFCTLAFQYEIL
jgi:hypothetical protein